MSGLEEQISKLFDKEDINKKSIPIKTDPDSEWSHKGFLISSYDIGDADQLSQILNKHMALAKFDDDLDLKIAMRDFALVINPLFQMKVNEKDPDALTVIDDLLKYFLVQFIGKLIMTRSKGGFERELQANRSAKSKKRGFSLKDLRRNPEAEQEDNQLYFE